MKKQKKGWLLLLVMMLLVVIAPLNVSAAKKPTPGKVQVTRVAPSSYNKINIRWNKTSQATHYKIYYKTTGARKWIQVAAVSNRNTSYTHTSSKKFPIVCGQKYTYTVRAYNSKYKTYGRYDTKGRTTYTRPTTVKLNKAVTDSKKTKISVFWNKAYGGTHYAVYRKTGNGGWKRIANVSGRYTSFTDRNPVKGQKNIYTVRAYNSKTRVYGNYDKRGLSAWIPAPVKNYTVKFDAQGGKAVASRTVKAGTTIKLPTTTRSGYRFLGWYTSKTGGSKITSLKVTKNTTLYAKWKKNPEEKYYTLYLDSQGGTYVGDMRVKAGTVVTLPEITRPGWEFRGWHDADWKLYTKIKVVEDTYLYAWWKNLNPDPLPPDPEPNPNPERPQPTPEPVKTYTFTFDSCGGSFVPSQTVEAGTLISMPTPTRDGYTFIGWFTQPEGGSKIDSFVVNENFTVYAQWEKIQTELVENITLAGGEGTTIGIWHTEISSNIDYNKVKIEFNNTGNIYESTSIDVYPGKCIRFGVRGIRQGHGKVFAKYNGKVIKTWNLTVTSDWTEYLEYTAWRKSVESQIWNNSMNVVQKLDAARDYIKTNFKYSNKSGSAVYAYKNKLADCITSSEMMGDFAKDLGLKVGYYNVRTGKIYDTLVESYSVSDGHICNMIMLNGQWVEYDAQPPH